MQRSSPAIARVAYGSISVAVMLALLFALREVLTPVLVAFALAYLLDPLVDRLETMGVPRALGIGVLLVASLLVLALCLLWVVPPVARDLAALARELPAALARLLAELQTWLEARGIALPQSGQEALAAVQDHLRALSPDAVAMVRSAARVLLGGTLSAASALAAVLLVPVLAFYLLRDFDRITAALVELLPARLRAQAVAMGREVDQVLGQFVRGQLTVMAILAVLYAAGFALLSVRLAIPIGIVAGLLSFIPYVGSAVALALALLMTALHLGSVSQYLGVVLVYSGIQTLEGFVITPRIVGDKLGLSPVWVLLALMAGAELFGFLGVMLALPVSAVIKVFVGQALRSYRSSALYGAGAGLAVAQVPVRPARLRRLAGRRAPRRVRAFR